MNDEHEVVWRVGDGCRVRWSGDNEVYTGAVRKLRRTKTGAVRAVVSFLGFDSADDEEVDVHLLEVAAKKRGDNVEKAMEKVQSEEEEGRGFFRPLTGTEESSRIEDKYKNVSDSDSHHDTDSPDWISPDWISPTPYGTKGKVSQWKVKVASPVKSRASQRRKARGAQGGSPRKNTTAQCTAANTATVSTPNVVSPKTNSPRPGPSNRADCVTTTDSNANNRVEDLLVSPTDGHLFEGFDEDDMEKPKFNFTAPSAKIPYCLDDEKNVQVPAPLNQYLRDYQRDGIKFLYSHFVQGRGAILGDDMGLGKTVQVIGFLSALMGKTGDRMDVMRQKPRFIRMMSDTPGLMEDKKRRPFLIVGPGSVLYNWLEELDTWGHFIVRKYHGADKASCLSDALRGKVEVVVTTFETCRDNVGALNKVQWKAVIADEVHRIKGQKAQTTQALRSLKCVRRYGLTGTALQNNMSELWCILDWAQSGVLGSAEDFVEHFVGPIEQGQKQHATKRELAEARKKKEEFAAVRSQMLIRRTKKLIADQLPKKTDRVVFCRLTTLQVSVYQAVLGHRDMQVVLHKDESCVCGSGKRRGKCCFKKLSDGRSPKSAIFSFMHVLLKASNHVALLIPRCGVSSETDRRARKMCDVAFKDHPEFLALARDAAFRTLSDPQYCGKMKVLHGMLSVFAKSHSKVLVFSYSTRLLDILEQHVMSEACEYRRIDGSVAGRRRQEIVREFNTDPNITLCLVSTKAGGLGLNMTGANKVVIFDPNWNPSHDLQAQDRAYRIGQRRDVEVFRLVSVGTIEENIYLRQVYKQQLDNVAIGTENARRYFKGIQGDAENKGELFGVKNMFSLRTGDSCLTMDILNRNSKVEAGIAGHDVADYIPSWHEQQGEATTDNDSSGEGSADSGQSSDEETSLQILKDFLGEVSDDDVGEEKERQTPKKGKRAKSVEPQPSTSGLKSSGKRSPLTTQRRADSVEPRPSTSGLNSPRKRPTPNPKRRMRFIDSESEESSEEETTGRSKASAPQRRTVAGVDRRDGTPRKARDADMCDGTLGRERAVGWSDRSPLRRAPHSESDFDFSERASTSHVLDFLDEADSYTSPKGKALTEKARKEKEDQAMVGATSSKGKALKEKTGGRKGDPSALGVNSSKGKALVRNTGRREEAGVGGLELGSKGDQSPVPVVDSLVTPSFSSINSVFERCGVVHTHDNRRVVGGSRVEDHISRCAITDVFELSANSQAPALLCDPMSQPSEEEQQTTTASTGKKRGRGGKTAKDHNSARVLEHGRWRLLIGQTPTAIRKKQWQQLKDTQMDSDDIALAVRVVGASPDERVSLLRDVYRRHLSATLHSVLPDAVSKPAEPPDPVTPVKKVKKAAAVKPTSSKRQAKKGGTRDRQTPSSASKPPAVRRKRAAQGAVFDDHHDSQQTQPHNNEPQHSSDNDLSSDDSGFNIGAKVSPAKVRATQRRRRGAKKVQTDLGGVMASHVEFDDEEMNVGGLTVSRKTSEKRRGESRGESCAAPTEDVSGLLDELGRGQSDTEADGQREARPSSALLSGRKQSRSPLSSKPGVNRKTKLSVLDDIFSESDDAGKTRRKPPPSRHGQRLRTEKTNVPNNPPGHGQRPRTDDPVGNPRHRQRLRTDETDGHNPTDILSDLFDDPTGGAPRPNGSGKSNPLSSPEEFSDMMNNSTLADDDVDCFGESSQWKKRVKVGKKPVKTIDRLLQESKDNYLHLFESGRLVKKRQRLKEAEVKTRQMKQGELSRREAKRTASSEVDPSASLF